MNTCAACPADGDVWKEVEVPKASSYTWGRVEVPTEHGKVVQLAAGGLLL